MFLCDNCHNVNAHLDLFRSRGQCEGCGKLAACIDCHFADCPAPPKPGATTKQDRRAAKAVA